MSADSTLYSMMILCFVCVFSEVEFPNSVKSSAAAVQKGNEDVVAVVNKVIKENTDNGNFKKWTDEYSRKAVENADKQ